METLFDNGTIKINRYAPTPYDGGYYGIFIQTPAGVEQTNIPDPEHLNPQP